jgi:hypothetical protein
MKSGQISIRQFFAFGVCSLDEHSVSDSGLNKRPQCCRILKVRFRFGYSISRHIPPLPLGEDTKPYERSELGGVGEGFCPIDSAQPLTQLQLGNKLPSLRNPLPKGEGGDNPSFGWSPTFRNFLSRKDSKTQRRRL